MALSLALLCLLVAGAPARAQQDPFLRGIDMVPLKPTAALRSGIALEGAQAAPAGSYQVGLLLDSSLGILALRLGDEKLGDLIPYRVDAHLLMAWQPHARLEVAADVPLTLSQGDRFGLLREVLAAPDFPGAAGVSRTAPGDVRLLPRLFLLSPESFPVGLALVAEVRLPTGDAESFLGERGVVLAPRLALERTWGPVRVLGNVGMRLRPPGQYLNLLVDDELTLGAGATLALPDVGGLTQVRALGEMHLATPLATPFTFRDADSLKTPWGWLAGLRARVQGPWAVELSVGRGVSLGSGYGREAFRSLLSVRYEREALPPADGADSDGDGIPDARDACPTQAEDKDGFEDEDGCPEADNDGDGVVDGEDGCPTQAGPKDYDGCPDEDGDEIPDNVDKCPGESGPADLDGCSEDSPPYVVIEKDRLRVKGEILFESGKAKIQRKSLKFLDEMATLLTSHPDVGPIRIEGHTDNVGARAYNQDLSQRRAEAVRAYLIEKGVGAARLVARGYGLDKPIAPNTTPLGRAKNRRVEFRIVPRSP